MEGNRGPMALEVVTELERLAELLEARPELYVRWSPDRGDGGGGR
ncbi:hypothetical protein GCM10010182_50750 [Actinomadura cremea]|nr:hypothetical protein GCM10010182_50750 [Actinomadura cremea]